MLIKQELTNLMKSRLVDIRRDFIRFIVGLKRKKYKRKKKLGARSTEMGRNRRE